MTMCEPMKCEVCGLSVLDIPPQWRFVDKNGKLVCKHWFGTPAKLPN